jgi:16S rRNA (cytosine967-C5)-methyltransferase
MSKRPFREHHLLTLINDFQDQRLPLDLFMSHYFRAHKALGPKDRGVIAETIYAMIRWQGLIDYICEKPISWEKRLEIYNQGKLESYKRDETIPLHVRLSFPKFLFELVERSHGPEKAIHLCRTSNGQAPTTIRVNPSKITREALLERWGALYHISPCKHSPYGIIFHKKINFFSLAEFKEGLFEVQDEGSQLLAGLLKAEPGQLIMDYCCGSGGKTLAFAPLMENKGQIYLHDIRRHALMECRKRLRRAGIQNAQIIESENDAKLKKLKKKMNWVLVDAPCSGTGTMRRNPEMKWNFTPETLPRLVGLQRSIFEKALSFMRPDGRIIFATCSILNEENQEQLTHFLKTYELKIEGEIFQTLPSEREMDGFFGVVLKH